MRLSRLLVLALLLCAAAVAQAALPIPKAPGGRINDYAGVLSAEDRARLEDKVRAREQGSSNQVVVAIFRSLQGESLEDYSIRLAQAWRVGQKGLDNGVIFLVFVEDRKMRLEVGYGLESKLTDALSSQILRQVVAPRFREGTIADGIAAGLDAIEEVVAGAGAPADVQPSAGLRVHLDHVCPGDGLQRAIKVCVRLGMPGTAARDAVLVSISVTDRKLAVIGDKGVHERVGEDYWQGLVA